MPPDTLFVRRHRIKHKLSTEPTLYCMSASKEKGRQSVLDCFAPILMQLAHFLNVRVSSYRLNYILPTEYFWPSAALKRPEAFFQRCPWLNLVSSVCIYCQKPCNAGKIFSINLIYNAFWCKINQPINKNLNSYYAEAIVKILYILYLNACKYGF